jgi:hypothetical protein
MLNQWRVWSLLVVLAVAGPASAGGAVEFDRKKVLAVWDSLARKIKSIRIEAVDERHYAFEGKPMELKSRVVSKYAANRNGYLAESQNVHYEKGKSNSTPWVAQIGNPQYTAILNGPKDDEGWSLLDLKLAKNTAADPDIFALSILPWLAQNGVRLAFWIADDSFVVKKTEAIHGEAGELLRVHFAYDRSKRKEAYVRGKSAFPDYMESGYIDLDPMRSYRVVGYEYHLKDSQSQFADRAVFEYDGSTEIPILRKVTTLAPQVRHQSLGVLSSKNVSEYTTEYNVAVDDEDFRLSHFGLPEPAGVAWPAPTRWYLWFILVGVMSLLVGAFFWRRAQRRKVDTAPPAPLKLNPQG